MESHQTLLELQFIEVAVVVAVVGIKLQEFLNEEMAVVEMDQKMEQIQPLDQLI